MQLKVIFFTGKQWVVCYHLTFNSKRSTITNYNSKANKTHTYRLTNRHTHNAGNKKIQKSDGERKQNLKVQHQCLISVDG